MTGIKVGRYEIKSGIKVRVLNYLNNYRNIGKRELDVLKKIIKKTDEIDIIYNKMEKIICDNKIEIHNVPQFINLYESINMLMIKHKTKIKIYNTDMRAILAGELLKVVIDMLIEMGDYNIKEYISVNLEGYEGFENYEIKEHEDKKILKENLNNIIDECVKIKKEKEKNKCKLFRYLVMCCCI